MKKLVLPLLILLFLSAASAFQSGNEIRRIEGKDYRVYKVQKGDTWYAIARKFEISYAELRIANKGATDNLEIGKEMLIPAKLKANDPYFQKNYTDNKPKDITTDKFHIVQQSQTLFSIAKMYDVSVDQIKEWNKLSSNSISVGQKLVVSKGGQAVITEDPKVVIINDSKPVVAEQPVTPPPAEVKPEIVSPPVVVIEKQIQDQKPGEIDTSIVTSGVEDMVSSDVTEVKSKESPSNAENTSVAGKPDDVVFGNGRTQINETGTAIWTNEEDSYSDKYYAYHRTAKIGTVIRVMNLENSRKIYVKVIGQLPDDSEHEGVLILLSKASAEKLNITEKSARVNLLYGAGDE